MMRSLPYFQAKMVSDRTIYQIDNDLNQVTILLIGPRSRVYE
ncbi:MAG: hypothetical protein V7L04_20635 [Nostoc sp.]